MYELELFAGAGGGILAQQLLGHLTVGAVEITPYCRNVLLQRQRDLCLPVFPVWDDVTTFRADNPECAAYIGWLRSPTSAGCDPSGASSASAEASLARISRLAARVSASPEQNPGSGTRWRALSTRFNRHSCLPKTAPCSPREDSGQSLSRWPRWGMMRDGVCWELTISDIRSSASACGYWGCVTASMGKDMTPGAGKAALLRSTYGAQRTSLVCKMLTSTGCWPTVLLCERLMGWPDQWSRSEPLATVKFRQWLLSHGGSSLAA